MLDIIANSLFVVIGLAVLILLGILAMLSKWYRKAAQGQALVRTGIGGIKVSFSGIMVVPVLHKLEIMDTSLKSIVISRIGKDGLVCKDNMRADIKVAFFVRVNQNNEDVKKVAQSVGCVRASSKEALVQLFEAKFSEALKTVGKSFDFVELYTSRENLRSQIIETIGRQLNGYVLDDAAIDYLEQTPLESLDENNILDAEGIKKIIDLTSQQKIQSNLIERDKQKVIKQQDVEAREAILELERQLAEKEEKQKREIANIKSREEAEAAKVAQEELLKSERARIITEEEVQIAEQNKQREVIVAEKNKERTAAVETERVEKDRELEATERQRVVELAQIEKEKAIEEEKKNIQEVIRDRVAIERTVVDEEEKIKDTRATAGAEREKMVAITKAEEIAEANLVQKIKEAEAAKESAEFLAKQKIIDAEADQASATQRAEAIKILAEAEAAKEAAHGISEAQVMEAKAAAREIEGDAEAAVIEAKALAEAKGIQAKSNAQAEADQKLGIADADVQRQKGLAEAEVTEAKAFAEEKRGAIEATVIEQKAEAMKKLDGVGKDHEEFKLRLEKDKEIELAGISIQKDIADAQAEVISNALKTAKIDIVGGETVFFDKIIGAISNGKAVDRTVQNSEVISAISSQLLEGGSGDLKENLKKLATDLGVTSEDLKNLTISALLFKLMHSTNDSGKKNLLENLLSAARSAGISDQVADQFLNS